MSYFLLAYSILYAFGLAGLLWVTRFKKKYYAHAKGLCSILFVLGAVLALLCGKQWQFPGLTANFVLLLVALVLCMAGDVLIGLANRSKKLHKTPFLGGAASFALAHVLFCVLYYRYAPFRWYDCVLPLVLLFIMWVLEKRDLVRLKKMRPVAYIYTFMVGLMFAKSCQAALGYGLVAPQGICIVAGSFLFLVSDIILLFLYFGTKRGKWTRYANLSTYYAGIYLIAMSAFWM